MVYKRNKNEIEHAGVLNRAVEMLDKKYVALKSGSAETLLICYRSLLKTNVALHGAILKDNFHQE